MSDSFRVETIVTEILRGRGIAEDEQERFLHPDFVQDQHDAHQMLGMSVAIERLKTAITAKERIVIFGDYDADGVPATALLVRAFKRLGVMVVPIIPSRADGYGLSAATIPLILKQKPKVVITVDNGTVAHEQISELADAGVEVIVIDHHDPHEGIVAERALAVINPKQSTCPYPFKELCGCGLAWKVMDQLYRALGENPESLKWDLDLVAISTIADMVPLVGENRLFTMYGLKVLRKTRNLGIEALSKVAGFTLVECSTGDVGFKIAPRINAPSRMHQEELNGANAALQLLITESRPEAAQLAAYLHAQNAERQQLVDAHLEEAERQAKSLGEMRAIIVYHKDWSSGVIGLVASKLLDRYKRPAIALATEGEVIKGSVRSVDGIHALDLLKPGEHLMERYGGHAKAAGLTLLGEVVAFREALETALVGAGHTVESMALAAQKKAEYQLELADITLELIDALTELEPFGVGFPQPLFAVKAQLAGIRGVGSSQQHLSCMLTDGAVQKKAIGFNKAYLQPESARKYVVDCTLGKETWREVTSPVCYLQHLR